MKIVDIRPLPKLLAIATLTLSFAVSVGAQQPTSRVTRRGPGGRYAMVNGLRMYYEVRGRGGIPLVLMHGAFSNIATDFGKMIPTLSKNRMVITIEAQGHGHTPDTDSALTYESMADRVAELLRQLRVERADFMGYSMGGGTALYLAVRHPTLVRKLVYIGGASYKPDGFYPQLLEGEAKMTARDLAGTPWQKAYARIAPNPQDWPKLVEKIKAAGSELEGTARRRSARNQISGTFDCRRCRCRAPRARRANVASARRWSAGRYREPAALAARDSAGHHSCDHHHQNRVAALDGHAFSQL